jgi:hypothetical protein
MLLFLFVVVRFHMYNGSYPGLTEHMRAANLDSTVSYHDSIFDFSNDDDSKSKYNIVFVIN